ncbi:MAG: hypothetical protein MJZ34_05765 [Paludibacteraceae bacterium]|nr:hypothetical protein [Paludibacteraceae bacterium]
MKRIFLLLASITMLMSNSFAEKVSQIEFANKGKFALGVMIGVPGIRSTHENRANMPSVMLDCNWGVADGFINTKTFGKNGAVDLGFLYSFCHYRKWDEKHFGYLQNTALFRAAFHFEFVKRLDVFAGLTSGVNIYTPAGQWWTDEQRDNWDHAKYAGGMFTGCKWYFTDVFGVKTEFQFDWGSPGYGNLPTAAVGVTFNFK